MWTHHNGGVIFLGHFGINHFQWWVDVHSYLDFAISVGFKLSWRSCWLNIFLIKKSRSVGWSKFLAAGNYSMWNASCSIECWGLSFIEFGQCGYFLFKKVRRWCDNRDVWSFGYKRCASLPNKLLFVGLNFMIWDR